MDDRRGRGEGIASSVGGAVLVAVVEGRGRGLALAVRRGHVLLLLHRGRHGTSDVLSGLLARRLDPGRSVAPLVAKRDLRDDQGGGIGPGGCLVEGGGVHAGSDMQEAVISPGKRRRAAR